MLGMTAEAEALCVQLTAHQQALQTRIEATCQLGTPAGAWALLLPLLRACVCVCLRSLLLLLLLLLLLFLLCRMCACISHGYATAAMLRAQFHGAPSVPTVHGIPCLSLQWFP